MNRVLVAGLGLTVLITSACGKKGPPLAPLRPVPAAPTTLTARLAGDRVTVAMTLPSVGTDPTQPLSLSRVEIYARTLPVGSPAPVIGQLLQPEYRVGEIAVRPPASATAATPDTTTAPEDTRPAPGDTVTWIDSSAATSPAQPLTLTREQAARLSDRQPLRVPLAPSGLVVPVTPVTLSTRYYVAVGVSDRRRLGPASAMLAVPFGPVPALPQTPTLTFTETALTLTWTTTEVGAPVSVIETDAAGGEHPTPVQVAPLTKGSWSTPVVFGVERCFVVRQVVVRGAVTIESAPAGPVCETPVDRFAPLAPTGLEAVPTPDNVTLIWEPVNASDLAGYLVLRGEGAGETLRPLTPAPVTSLQFADTTARAGVRYVYAVVAVDAAGNQSALSNRAIVDRLIPTGR